MAINKVIYGGETLIDLTGDTVDAAHILTGYKAHNKAGESITGTCSYDSNTTDATAGVAEILLNKTAYVNGSKLTGTMPNNGSVSGTISRKTDEYTVPIGYHDGSGKVSILSTEKAKIIAENIKSGVSILGVTGSYAGEAVSAAAVNITPYTTSQTVLPPQGYDYISQANVAAIAYTETDNAAGGKTVTIGTVAP